MVVMNPLSYGIVSPMHFQDWDPYSWWDCVSCTQAHASDEYSDIVSLGGIVTRKIKMKKALRQMVGVVVVDFQYVGGIAFSITRL